MTFRTLFLRFDVFAPLGAVSGSASRWPWGTPPFQFYHVYPEEMAAIRALDKEQRFFNMDYKEAEQFMLNLRCGSCLICHSLKV